MAEPATPRLIDVLRRLYIRELRAFQREIELFPDEQTIWRTAPGVTNSAANLAFHVCGNVQHYVGHVLGATGYVRDRDREFARRDGTRAEIAAEIERTIGVLESVMPGLGAETLAAEYPEVVGGVRLDTDVFLMHLSAHLAHHLGQPAICGGWSTATHAARGPFP